MNQPVVECCFDAVDECNQHDVQKKKSNHFSKNAKN